MILVRNIRMSHVMYQRATNCKMYPTLPNLTQPCPRACIQGILYTQYNLYTLK